MLFTFIYKVISFAFIQIIVKSALLSIYQLEFCIICCWIQLVNPIYSLL